MNEEIKMYVHEIDWDTLCDILTDVNNVNKLFSYNMPKKAETYANDGFSLVNEINAYGSDEEEKWRVEMENNLSLQCENGVLIIGDWVIQEAALTLCIPKINSIIIIPKNGCKHKGNNEYTKILQLTNCVSVTPLLLRLRDVPKNEEMTEFDLGVNLEIIKEEKPTE